jgi:hypothetical protein
VLLANVCVVVVQAWHKAQQASRLPQNMPKGSKEYKVRGAHYCMHAYMPCVCQSTLPFVCQPMLTHIVPVLLANVCVVVAGVAQGAASLPPAEHAEGQQRVPGAGRTLLHACMHAVCVPVDAAVCVPTDA